MMTTKTARCLKYWLIAIVILSSWSANAHAQALGVLIDAEEVQIGATWNALSDIQQRNSYNETENPVLFALVELAIDGVATDMSEATNYLGDAYWYYSAVLAEEDPGHTRQKSCQHCELGLRE